VNRIAEFWFSSTRKFARGLPLGNWFAWCPQVPAKDADAEPVRARVLRFGLAGVQEEVWRIGICGSLCGSWRRKGS
jgi:hypothetical protein